MNSVNLTARTVSRIYFALSLMFGFYLMAHGHISHGAGFAGGVIIALAFLQALMILGAKSAGGVINSANARLVILLGGAAYLILSALGYFYGGGFMSDFLGLGQPFSLLSAGAIVLYNITLGFGAAGCLIYIYLSLFEQDR